MKRTIWIAVACATLISAVLACGSGGGTDDGSLSTGRFKKVCDGEGVEDTAFYGSSDEFAPIKVFRRSDPDEAYIVFAPQSGDYPKAWHSQDADQTELVLCLTVTEREMVTECYYANEDGGEEIELTEQLYNSTYEAVLRNAANAKEYASTEFVAETSGECAEYTLDFTEAEVRRIDADPGAYLVEFLEPWVLP